MIAKETLEQIFQTTFTASKDNWKAKCPFHTEKTPSFYVHKYDFIGNCFGCGVSGSLDLLVADYLGITQGSAKERLGYTAADGLDRARKRVRETERAAVQVFPESWLSPWKKEVHKSVIERGFTLHTLQSAESRFDRSQGRQVFPHRNREGNLIGALGRTCRGHPDKWYFYWGYDKGQNLWRLGTGDGRDLSSPRSVRGLSEPTLQTQTSLIIVEGVFDALWLHQNGYRNVAAILGSKATAEQIREIKLSAENVLLALDNDDAGREGNRRLFRALRKSVPTRLLEYPSFAKDPCDLTGEQLDECIALAKTPGQLSLQHKAEWLFREDKKYSPKKARTVRRYNETSSRLF